MEFHKITVEVDGRTLEATVKEGVIATVEIGKHVNRAKTPGHKIWILSGKKEDKPFAWIQVARVINGGALSLTHEGWVGDGRQELASVSSSSVIKAGVAIASEVPPKSKENLERAKHGVFGCCTAYGSGCYVTCCNGCCADPTGCPGASCCG